MTIPIVAELLRDFLVEAQEQAQQIEERLLSLERTDPGERSGIVAEAKRALHTLKGNSGMLGFSEIQSLAHRMEDAVGALDPQRPEISRILHDLDGLRRRLEDLAEGAEGREEAREAEAGVPGELESGWALTGVRVPFSTLDRLVDDLAEVVIFRNRLADAITKAQSVVAVSKAAREAWDSVAEAEQNLGKTLTRIQGQIMELRLVPLRSLFTALHRIVYDETAKEGKEVHFETAGGDTPLDKGLLEVASEALGHLVRNAIIHGIEGPEERVAVGKPRSGTVRLSAAIHSGEVQIEVWDDGRGVDREGLLASARRLGIQVPQEDDLPYLLFHTEVSTRRQADLSSGRGVGLSAVYEAVHRRGGHIDVVSEFGVGTHFRLHLPLRVSIIRALLARVEGEEYALPLTAVVETLSLQPGDTHRAEGAGVYRWRKRVIPLVDLGQAVGTRSSRRQEGYIVVLLAEGKWCGLVVEELAGIREIVVKGLDPLLGAPRGIGGSTILADGRAVLILDPYGLVSMAAEEQA